MRKSTTKPDTNVEMQIQEINRQTIVFHVLGLSPLIYNAMSAKTVLGLLVGTKPKTRAEKASTVKHNPLEEYRGTVYCRRDGEVGPTRLILPGHMFKAAIREAALRIPGATKTEINQLVQVEDINVDLHGIPQLIMNVMRSADINRTPDVRSRAVVPEWATTVHMRYVTPMLSSHSLAKLFSAAGEIVGVGDSRPQKGYTFGRFKVVTPSDPDFQRVMKSSSMAKQDLALRSPVYYDRETEQLMSMYSEYMTTRDEGKEEAVKAPVRKRRGGNGATIAAD